MSYFDEKEVTFWGSDTTHFIYQTSAQPLPNFSQYFISVPTQAPCSLSFFCIIFLSKCTLTQTLQLCKQLI